MAMIFCNITVFFVGVYQINALIMCDFAIFVLFYFLQ